MTENCLRCEKSVHEHRNATLDCPDGGGSFTFQITKDDLTRMEVLVANMKRLRAGEDFPHCPVCLNASGAPLATCSGCQLVWCAAHMPEHAKQCVAHGDRERWPTPAECAWAEETVKGMAGAVRQERANWLHWAIVMDDTIAKGYMQGPRINVPRAHALQDALKEAGYSYDGVTGPDILFAKEK